MERWEIEQLAFLYLCRSTDRAYVNGECKMAYRDFERLTYIASRLGFWDLEIRLWKRYAGKVPDELERWINAFENEGVCVEKCVWEETEKHEGWLKEFCSTAPTKRVRSRLVELLELDM